MPRSVKEWVGPTPDTKAPPRVLVRVFDAADGRCGNIEGSDDGCGIKIRPGMEWHGDHIIAIINGGENRESNMQPLCTPCHRLKTREDVAEKATVAKKRKKALGVSKSRWPAMAGTKRSGWKKKMNGTVVRRN